MKWNWILIIFIILFVGIIIAIVSRIVYSDIDKKSIEISSIKDYEELKSGDLVFVSYKNLLGKTIRVLSASEWSHVGMIYRERESEDSPKSPNSPDSIYVLEVAEYKDQKSSGNHDLAGVLKIPYTQWLKLNKHHDIYIRKLNTKDYESKEIQNKLLDEFTKLQKYKQQKLTDILELKRMMFFEPYNQEKIDKLEKITCIELIVMMLQNLELMDKESMPASYYPCDLASNEFLKTYGSIKKIV
jgi:hypothetical protein